MFFLDSEPSLLDIEPSQDPTFLRNFSRLLLNFYGHFIQLDENLVFIR